MKGVGAEVGFFQALSCCSCLVVAELSGTNAKGSFGFWGAWIIHRFAQTMHVPLSSSFSPFNFIHISFPNYSLSILFIFSNISFLYFSFFFIYIYFNIQLKLWNETDFYDQRGWELLTHLIFFASWNETDFYFITFHNIQQKGQTWRPLTKVVAAVPGSKKIKPSKTRTW